MQNFKIYEGDNVGNKEVAIKFKYYRVCKVGENNRTEKYDLMKFIESVNNKNSSDLKQTVNGTTGRIEKIIHEGITFYGLNFMRMDSISNEYKIKNDGEAEHIDLEEGEYIGKNTVVMYDRDNHVLMVQSNRGGFSETAIQNYMNIWSDELDAHIVLSPILNNIDKGFIRNKMVRSFEIRIEDVSLYKPKTTNNFNGIISCMNEMGNKSLFLKLSVGRTKSAELNNDKILDVYDDVVENQEAIKSARAKIYDDGKSATIDLLENFEHSFIVFNVKERGELKFKDVFDKMIEVYKSSVRNKVCLN